MRRLLKCFGWIEMILWLSWSMTRSRTVSAPPGSTSSGGHWMTPQSPGKPLRRISCIEIHVSSKEDWTNPWQYGGKAGPARECRQRGFCRPGFVGFCLEFKFTFCMQNCKTQNLSHRANTRTSTHIRNAQISRFCPLVAWIYPLDILHLGQHVVICPLSNHHRCCLAFIIDKKVVAVKDVTDNRGAFITDKVFSAEVPVLLSRGPYYDTHCNIHHDQRKDHILINNIPIITLPMMHGMIISY